MMKNTCLESIATRVAGQGKLPPESIWKQRSTDLKDNEVISALTNSIPSQNAIGVVW